MFKVFCASSASRCGIACVLALLIPFTVQAQCNPYADSDGDYVNDCADGCPLDGYKVDPGLCGCGFREDPGDRDGDGTMNCHDACPWEPTKAASEGICGCGVPIVSGGLEPDTDSDSTPDCIDSCMFDPHKTEPGECGCGIEESACVEFVAPPPGWRASNSGANSTLYVFPNMPAHLVQYPEGGYTARVFLTARGKKRKRRSDILEQSIPQLPDGTGFQLAFTVQRKKYASNRKKGSGRIQLCYDDKDAFTGLTEEVCHPKLARFRISRKGIIGKRTRKKK